MGTQGAGRKRSTNKDKTTAEDDALNLIAREAEARLAAKRAARAEAREIRMKELERQQKEKYYGLSPKADDRQDSKWGDIEQWMEDSERYTRPSRTHTLSDEDERMSVGSRGSVRSDLDIVGAFAGGGDSSSYSLKKSKKKKKHKHKDRNGYDDEYSVISSRSSRVSDESRASRSSRLDLTSSVLAEESRASRASRLDLQPTSYSTSDLYSLNGLSSSRPPVYNGYQLGRSLSQVPQQSYRRSSLYDDGLCSGSRRSAAHAPLDYSSYRSSGSRTSSRASSRAGSARTSPVDNSSSSVASFLRSAVNSGLPRDLDDVTIPDFPDVEDGNYLEKGCRAASALTATTLTSLGGTSSRRGSGETALTLDAETSIREIKEIHELKDQIQDVESKFSQNLKEAKDKLAEVEEKYRKAMVSNAQLDNEKNNLMYQVDTLKDSLMELEEQLAESRREYEDKAKDFEREKHAHTILQFQFNELKETLKQSEELLNEIRQLRIKEEGFHREISDLQETVDWKDKKISALERQKEYTDAIRSERDELREEVVHLKDILKKHGIVLGPDLNINGGLTEALNSDESSTDPNSQTVQETPISPAEGTNSMLGNSEEEAAEANKDPTQVPLPQNQEMHKDIEKQNFEDGVKENDASQVEMCANEDQQKTNIEHLEVVATDQVDGATHFEKSVVEAEPTEHKDIESPENAEVKPTSQDNLEEQIINKEVDSVQVIEAVESEKATEELAKEVQQNEPTVIESKVEIQQEPDAVDVDSEDASAKSKVTSGGGKKKKRKKRGKKKGATSEEQKEQKNGQENQTKSDATAADGGTTMQEGDIAGNGQASKENTSVDDSKDGTPATNPLAEQVGPISDIDKDSETNNSTESNENVELKVEESKSTDEHTQDEDQKNKEIDLVDATKDCTEEVGAMSGIEKDFETNGNDEVEPKVTNAEANLICLETEQADVSSGEATIGTSCILEGTDSANGQENMQSLDNGEQEIQNEASLEMREETGTSVSNIDAEDTNVNPSTSEKEKIVDEVHEKNDDTPSIESEQADTSISDRQVDNPELSVPDSNLEGSLGDVEEPKLLDDCNDKRLDIEEASTFVARDEILNNGECPTLQNVDSSQESTADDAISLGASGTTAVEVIDKVTTEINEIDKDKDAENKDSTVVDDELRSSEIEPDDARNLSVKCSNDNDSEETNIASGELKSSEQEVEVDDVLVQEDASSEHLTDGKPNQKGENDTDDLEKVDTAEENTVHVDSKSVIEKLNDPSDEDKVEKPPAHVNVEVGLDGLAEDDSDLNRQDQSLESESQRQGQDAENDHKDLEMFEAEREIAHQDIELPENCDNDLNTEGIKSQNEEEEVEPGVDVSVEDDMKDLIHSELQNDDTEFEDLDLQPTNLAQDDSNDPICQIVDSSENNSTEEDAKPSKTPMGQDADDEEDEAEGLSFDFDDLEMEAAIAESESKNADEEFEVAVEVLADEATVKDDSLEMQREVKSESDDTSKKDDDVVDKGEELAVTNDASLDKIGATSEQALIVPDATPNRSENNNKRSSLTDGGSDLPVIQSKDTPGGQSRQERGADGEQARSGKKSSKKSKGKGKDECKMT